MKYIAILFLLSSCAQYEAAKMATDIAADKVVDGAYALTCNMRYKTESRFKARNSIETLDQWCKR